MPAGRPPKADPGVLYSFAHQFYWDFRRIAEGRTRRRLDRWEYERRVEEINKMELHLTAEQRANIKEVAETEIRSGRLKEVDKANFIRSAEDSQLLVTREDLRERASEEATRELRVPGEPDVIAELLQAETPEQVRAICEDAFVPRTIPTEPGVTRQVTMPNLPISAGSVLFSNLSKYAAEFIAARKDRRFPQSTHRPSSRLKQLWFVSRALAGALFGVRTRTAINLVGSKRPEEVFEESRSAKPSRKRARHLGGGQKNAGKK